MTDLTEIRRKGFEEYVKTANPDDYEEYKEKLFEWDGDTYVWTWVELDWELWNAAMDSVVVELPPCLDVGNDFGKGHMVGVLETKKAILSAGVKTNG